MILPIRKETAEKLLQPPPHNPNRQLLFSYKYHCIHINKLGGITGKKSSFTFFDDFTCERADGDFKEYDSFPIQIEDTDNIFYGTWKVGTDTRNSSSNSKVLVIQESDVYREKGSDYYGGDFDRMKKREERRIPTQHFPLDDDHLHRKSSEKFASKETDVRDKDVETYKLEGDVEKFLEFCQKKQIA